MASPDDPLISSAPQNPPASSTAHAPISVHRTLGGGKVADVLLWRRRNASASLLVGATAAWFLFEFAGYGLLSLLSNALLLLVSILFFWARSASLLNRPLPPLPNLEVSDRVVEKVADEVRVWVNLGLAIARDIALGHDRKLFLEVVLSLWAVSFVGSFFNFFTLVYIGVLLSLTVPALYDKYQSHIDEKLGLVHGLALKHYDNILSQTGRSVRKDKKAE